MREHAGLAHAHDLSHHANAQTLQPDLCGQAECGIHNGQLGLLPFLQSAAFGRSSDRSSDFLGSEGVNKHAVDGSDEH